MLRRNMYTSGMENVASFDVEYRIVNVKERKGKKSTPASTASNGDTMSHGETRALLVALGDPKPLAEWLVTVLSMDDKKALASAKHLIKQG